MGDTTDMGGAQAGSGGPEAIGHQFGLGRVLIAGTHSGVGKTTLTVALIAALRARGVPVASFKCGPDYIDPMLHRRALGVPAHNLDPFFSTPDALARSVADHGAGTFSIIEGVMGYYDGLGTTTEASTYEVAQATSTPVILAVNARGMGASLGAILNGFTSFRQPSGITGVILTQVPAKMATFFGQTIRDAGLTPLGCLTHDDFLHLPSRRLGLVTADEIDSIDAIVARLATLAEDMDIDGLLKLARQAPVLTPSRGTGTGIEVADTSRIRIAVARDEAFCFMYAETLELFERFGADLVFFSPLSDAHLPEGTAALYMPGGYPENHLPALSANSALRHDIMARIGAGLPTIAECGGFMYLHRDIDGHPMVGVIEASAFATPQLQRFGYTTLTLTRDSLLGMAGTSFPAHEFHYCDSTDPGNDAMARKASSGAEYPGGHATPTLYAGFPHLYLPAVPDTAHRFISQASRYAHTKAVP